MIARKTIREVASGGVSQIENAVLLLLADHPKGLTIQQIAEALEFRKDGDKIIGWILEELVQYDEVEKKDLKRGQVYKTKRQ